VNDKRVSPSEPDNHQSRDVLGFSWQILLVPVVAGIIVGALSIFLSSLSSFASYIVGFVVPLLVYRSLGAVNRLSHILALATTVTSGLLAGLFHTSACLVLSSDALSEMTLSVLARCDAGPVNATYFGAVCFPLLPAGMIFLIMFISSRSRQDE
jgi:hypothetical protein